MPKIERELAKLDVLLKNYIRKMGVTRLRDNEEKEPCSHNLSSPVVLYGRRKGRVSLRVASRFRNLSSFKLGSIGKQF